MEGGGREIKKIKNRKMIYLLMSMLYRTLCLMNYVRFSAYKTPKIV